MSEKEGIIPALIEKDYWIMHCLYGLQNAGLSFQLKGGTSLSKGYQIINRFSEDIDIRIDPQNLITNEAFVHNDESILKKYETEYKKTRSLYYKEHPSFGEIINTIRQWAERL